MLPKLDQGVDEDEDYFSAFFAFAFKFCLMVSFSTRAHADMHGSWRARRFLTSSKEGVGLFALSSPSILHTVASASLCDAQEPQQKILDIETAVQMLHVVLPEGNEHLEPFSRFLKEQTEYKYVNLDQWTSFYRFSEEVAPSSSRHKLCKAFGCKTE